MVDHFNVLGLGRKAEIPDDEIQKAFHALSREQHPDASAAKEGGDFAVVSEAYRVLGNPATRLKHLLALEFEERDDKPGAGGAGISEDLVQLFGKVGGALQAADEILAKREKQQTALGKAVLAKEELERQGKLRELAAFVDEEIGSACARFGEIDGLLESDREAGRQIGEALAARLGFLTKWQAKIREKIMEFV